MEHRICIQHVNLPIWSQTMLPVCVLIEEPDSEQWYHPCATPGSVYQVAQQIWSVEGCRCFGVFLQVLRNDT